jgi:hypothetical protein
MQSRETLIAIVDLLNELMQKQPDLTNVLNLSVQASAAVQQMEAVRCRVDPFDIEHLTMTGIISAIGRIIGADEGIEIRSVYEGEGDTWNLSRFEVGSSLPTVKSEAQNEIQ